jgi:hypothetical protein
MRQPPSEVDTRATIIIETMVFMAPILAARSPVGDMRARSIDVTFAATVAIHAPTGP